MKRTPANSLNAHKQDRRMWRDPPANGGPGSRRRSDLKNFCFPEDQGRLDLASRSNRVDTGITASNEKARICLHQAWCNLNLVGRDHRCSRTRQGRRQREVRRLTRKQLRLGKRNISSGKREILGRLAEVGAVAANRASTRSSSDVLSWKQSWSGLLSSS